MFYMLCRFLTRWYAERGIATASRLSVCPWHWGNVVTQVRIVRK